MLEHPVIGQLKIILLMFCLAFMACSARAEDITLNFVNADVESVIKAVGQITGKNFLIDPRVRGTVNIVSSKPVSRTLVYPILLSALRLQGFAAVESNGIVKIIPEADAKLSSGPTLLESGSPRGGELVTQVYTLKNQSATQILPVLRPLIAPNNAISVYPNSNALVITDYADNLKRIDSIIDAIDQSGGAEIMALHHASAIDVAQTLNKLMNEGAAADQGQHLAAVADTRTNSLLLRSGNSAVLGMARNLAARLDAQTGETGNVHVVYLKNASAVSLAKTLRGTSTGEVAADAIPAQPGAAHVAPPAAESGGMILADEAANALIITAPDAIYNNLRAVVEKLDVRQAEIYVEALVAEVSANKAAEFGIQWQNLKGLNSNTANVIGGTNFGSQGAGTTNIIGAATNISSVAQGLNIGIVKGQVTIPGVANPVLNLGMLARALETDASANILSTPNLLTLDNEEAKIVVGQNVPFITGSYAQTGTATTTAPFQTYERKDVGLMLKIKPQISSGDLVRLKIYQEVSSVDPTTTGNASGPTTNKRSIDSTVLVDDGQIIVLGGLIQDSVSENVSKVPVLGDLPLLGTLFSYKSRVHTKTNLMVFLCPHVLRNEKSYGGLTSDRYEYISGEEKKSQPAPSPMLPDIKGPVLPPLKPAK
ncbi:MAG: type II secretion system secretin GspD [Burkholderiales bacterium]|nr:type II secretion system secretin GspD [Burkholderiales bacterium]